MDEFRGSLDIVCKKPEIHAFSRMSELAARGYRSMLVGSYVMLNRAAGDVVYVSHIFHQSQDYARLA